MARQAANVITQPPANPSGVTLPSQRLCAQASRPHGIAQHAGCHSRPEAGATAPAIPLTPVVFFLTAGFNKIMILSKEYVGYMAREIAKKLIKGEFIETQDEGPVLQRVHSALLEEMSLEDRINDEVRAILEQYSDEMRKTGASYQEMFKKVKNELVRKYKAVL